MWSPEDPERSRTSPSYVWDSLRSALKSGYRLEPCPRFIMSADDLDDGAKRLSRESQFEACYRRVSDDWVNTEDVYLVKVGADWRIDRW